MADQIPGLVVNPHEKIALMRKGGTVRLSNYSRGGVIDQVTFGLAWVRNIVCGEGGERPRTLPVRHLTSTSHTSHLGYNQWEKC